MRLTHRTPTTHGLRRSAEAKLEARTGHTLLAVVAAAAVLWLLFQVALPIVGRWVATPPDWYSQLLHTVRAPGLASFR